MKKHISGKVYDTSTADLIGTYENEFSRTDYKWLKEELFRKRTGEFFLCGEGGPLTRYAKSIGNNDWSFGFELLPLSFEAARAWAKVHAERDVYDVFFGGFSKDEARKTIGISIAISTHDKAKRNASVHGTSLSEYIESLILSDDRD